MNDKFLKVAIQRKGRLNQPSKKFLASLGLRFSDNDRQLSILCRNKAVDIIKMRDNDIPKYVSQARVDFGIVGLDVLKESGEKVKIAKKLNFCGCKLVLAAPADSGIKALKDFNGRRIATSYPNILKKFLRRNKISSKIVFTQGSVELAPYLRAADAVCDITQTGSTLRQFNLVPIKTVLESQAVLITSPVFKQNKAILTKKLL